MRPPAEITPWQDVEQMFHWLQAAPDQPAYQRRLAIWLTHTGRLHARQVAETLGVATQSVWLWVGQYNRRGPAGLDRPGRGGRRWSLLSPPQEVDLITRCLGPQPDPPASLAQRLRTAVEAKLRRKVSLSYVYRLLSRHPAITAPGDSAATTDSRDNFARHSQPWRRQA